MDNAKQQAIDRIKQASNVLVTVSNNPSVDQLAACIGLTLVLNKLGKHATAVFSGQIPSTIEFLQPEKTLEKNTDSLRDFIIALDKSKADKLRYKVEDRVVKIFITPYRTSIGKDDLEFSQGDFNVDVVVALGVNQQPDLDQAITAHGRILHDATVISMNNKPNGDLGNINWQETKVSSLSELVAMASNDLSTNNTLFDEQISTALMTGIVAETNRFSNDKTSAQTMSISAQLIAAGANQQLVASKLEQAIQPAEQVESAPIAQDEKAEKVAPEDQDSKENTENNDGTIEIQHEGNGDNDMPSPSVPEETEPDNNQIDIDDHGNFNPNTSDPTNTNPVNPSDDTNTPAQNPDLTGGSPLDTTPPTLGGTLTANSQNETAESTIDPLSLPTVEPPLLNRDEAWSHDPSKTDAPTEPVDAETLSEIEQSVDSPHLDTTPDASLLPPASKLVDARDAVEEAINSNPDSQPLEPIQALNSQPVFDFHEPNTDQTQTPTPDLSPLPPPSNQPFLDPQPSMPQPLNQDSPIADNNPPALQPFDPTPPSPMPANDPLNPITAPDVASEGDSGENPPPPVPPPLMMPPVV